MKHLWLASLSAGCLLAVLLAADQRESSPAETTAGWRKYDRNPVLGGSLGTCFDVSVLREGDQYRMWFSWRPRKSIALVTSRDGLTWGEPTLALGPHSASGWEEDVNRPMVLEQGGKYWMWYTGQARGKSWIGLAISEDGKSWRRVSDKPVLSPQQP